jgi:glycosyltransferase involved in cell wall biosynthesis
MAAQLDHVSIFPFVLDRLELATMYRNADFYIAAGPGETFGLAIAEAMACVRA